FSTHYHHLALLSFPTRRSSDLSFTCEVFFVVVTDVGASHVLVLHASDTLTDLLTLNAFHVSQHAFFCEVAFCQVVGRQRSSVVRDRKSTRLNSSHVKISYAVFC